MRRVYLDPAIMRSSLDFSRKLLVMSTLRFPGLFVALLIGPTVTRMKRTNEGIFLETWWKEESLGLDPGNVFP